MKGLAAILSVGFFLAMTGSAVGAVVTDGLVSYWTFDTVSVDGVAVKDVWGQNHGTMQGDPEIVAAGKVAQAIDLDGDGDWVTIDDPRDIPVGDDTYAMEAWFFADAPGARAIMGWGMYGTGNSANAIRLWGAEDPEQGSGLVNYWWGPDLEWERADPITGEWHHVIAQFDGTTRSLWFDGRMVASDEPGGHLAGVYVGKRL